ncbi:hypothetical protein PH189_15720 [Actinomycetospora chibensis]|nr:hypothetical protein [Actinomycetospora chibensis]MDD7925020.1 hypothetical protein [Actinomycetospora chibensis]
MEVSRASGPLSQRPLLRAHAPPLVKTTMLSALLGEVAPTERIVCVEDAKELRPAEPLECGLIDQFRV